MAHDSNGTWMGLGIDQITGVPDSNDDVFRVQHRLLYAYAKGSNAIENGLREWGTYDHATAQSVMDMAGHLNRTENAGFTHPVTDLGVANLKFRKRIKAYIEPLLVPKYPIQGVQYDTRAYLMPPDAHSFNKATAQGAREGLNLLRSKWSNTQFIGIGYSMGAKTLRDFEVQLFPEEQSRYLGSFNFGDPSMRPGGSLLGDDPGQGISGEYHPDWVANRYWSYSIDGDWYPRARGLLMFLYQVIARAELTLDFAMWLLTAFPLLAMQELTGLKTSNDDTGAAGILSPLANLMTIGSTIPMNPLSSLIGPAQMFMLLPEIIQLIIDAFKFMTTNAHGMYNDINHRNWDGMTGVEHAIATIRRIAPGGATLFLFPGSWANWDQGFDADTAFALMGDMK